MITTMDLVLTGARAGTTVVLNNKQFVKGVIRLRGSHEQLEPVIQYYGRAYAAFPFGSPALAAAQEQDRQTAREKAAKEHGNDRPHAASQPGSPDGVQRARADDNSGRDPAAASADQHQGNHGPQAGSPGVRSSGDGHADTGLRTGQEPGQQQHAAASDLNALRVAVMALDPDVVELWTADGKPTVEAVASATNNAAVTRKEIDAAAGDWTRDQASAKKQLAKG